MISYSIIQKTQLESFNRIDAEYYQPEYFIDFKRGNWHPIGNFLELCQYGISIDMNNKGMGYKIFRMDDIKNAFLVSENIKYADISQDEFNKYKLEDNDILFNRVNSEEFVGRTGIYKLNGLYTFASYLIRLRTKPSLGILPGYLNAFLNSSYGIKQIKKFSRRAVNQANVNAEELKRIKKAVIPLVKQKQISEHLNSSWQHYLDSIDLCEQAERILLHELGLENFQIPEKLSYTVNFSDIKTNGRMDADYFQPKYIDLEEKLKKYGFNKFSEIITNVAARINPYSKLENRYKYVELANISASFGIIDGYTDVLGKDAPSRAKRLLSTGDVIVSSVEGSLEKVALVRAEQEGYIASTGFFQLKSEEILPEALLVIAKSLVMQLQLEKRCAGTILTAVPSETLDTIIIPTLPLPVQKQLTNLVRQSYEARKKSKELLHKAKREVEEMIEK